MHSRTTAVLFVVGGLLSSSAFSQTASNPTQKPIAEQQDQVPVFRVTVVGRTTAAINYRPRSGSTKIDFTGTALLPKARGDATIKGEKGYIQIDAHFNHLTSAARFGPEFLTYVVWAITPEGRATNLGELQVDGDEGKLRVTTELQTFGLVVTAEPYFAVTQPSDVVVMENTVRKEGLITDGTIGKTEAVQARYELLKRGAYLMNQSAAQLKVKPLEPGAPLDLAEARNAVELARLAGSDRYAADTFLKAERLLVEAERAREHHRAANAVMMPARQAAQTAEDARLIALQKQEEAYVAEERALALQRESAALERARGEEARRRQAENDVRRAEAARADAERAKAEADLAAERLAQERQAEEARRRQAERDTLSAEASRAAAERAKTEAALAAERLTQERRAAEEARTAAEAARQAAEDQAQQSQRQAQATAALAEREKADLRDRLREQLNVILETRETARGLIVNLSDVLFDTGSATLKPGAREKLAKVTGILLSHPGLQVQVEGHTDAVGTDSYNQRLSEQRAESVRGYLVRQGIPPGTVATSGFGKSQPVVSNQTAAGRQQNRRVELVVSGEPIGRR